MQGCHCPGPGNKKGNLIVLPASKEAESPSNPFSSVQFSSVKLVLLTDTIEKRANSLPPPKKKKLKHRFISPLLTWILIFPLTPAIANVNQPCTLIISVFFDLRGPRKIKHRQNIY